MTNNQTKMEKRKKKNYDHDGDELRPQTDNDDSGDTPLATDIAKRVYKS